MSVVINSNTAASIAANNLAYSNQQLQKSLNKLSTGSKIVSPADDAGGLAVSMKLTATVNREGDLQTNLSDAQSFAQTQDGALQVAGSIVDRISQLKTLYADPTKNTSDLAELRQRVQPAPDGAEFPRQPGLQRHRAVRVDRLHGCRHGRPRHRPAAVTVAQQNLMDTHVGVGALLTTAERRCTSLGNITRPGDDHQAIQNVATMRANNGAEQSRLGFASTC